jgi:hypothetical protein
MIVQVASQHTVRVAEPCRKIPGGRLKEQLWTGQRARRNDDAARCKVVIATSTAIDVLHPIGATYLGIPVDALRVRTQAKLKIGKLAQSW